MKKEIGPKIRQIRELKGFSQEYMADKIGVSQRAYSKLETGQTKLDWKRITEIANIFEIDPIDIPAFDKNFVFHNSSQCGNFEKFTNNIPEKLIEQYEEHIKELQEQIDFLKKLVLKEEK